MSRLRNVSQKIEKIKQRTQTAKELANKLQRDTSTQPEKLDAVYKLRNILAWVEKSWDWVHEELVSTGYSPPVPQPQPIC